MNKIKVMVKEPHKKPHMVELDNTLESLQKTVEGRIETVRIAPDLTIICDEEGLLKDKRFNCTVTGIQLFGTIIFVGVKDDEFADLPISEEEFKFAFSNLYRR